MVLAQIRVGVNQYIYQGYIYLWNSLFPDEAQRSYRHKLKRLYLLSAIVG